MAYEMVMPYHLHMPSYFLETFTEYPFLYIPSFMGAHGSVIILGDLKTKGRISRFLRSVKVF